MIISFTIPDAKVNEVKAAILRIRPKPHDLTLTDLQWIKKIIRDWIFNQYVTGRRTLAEDATIIDETIIGD